MRCQFCGESVVGSKDPMTIVGVGSAHLSCYMSFQFQQRIFKGVDLTKLSAHELSALDELLQTEKNRRSRRQGADEDIELFA